MDDHEDPVVGDDGAHLEWVARVVGPVEGDEVVVVVLVVDVGDVADSVEHVVVADSVLVGAVGDERPCTAFQDNLRQGE